MKNLAMPFKWSLFPLIILMCLLSLGTSAQSGTLQTKKITGTVVDEKGQPIYGATVVDIKNNKGMATDASGKFTLNISADASFSVSYIGYATQTIAVGTKTIFNIKMVEDVTVMEEAVVIGYSTQKKKLVTGATLQVAGDKIQQLHAINPLSALQSLAPGVQITKTSGEPGSGFKVFVRGIGTIGDSQPLYIIDGVPGNIDNVNSYDIQSIDVLKDAASSAIYGARAANGVVLITTRRGRASETPSISYDGYYGIQTAPEWDYYSDAALTAMLADESSRNTYGYGIDFDQKVPDWDKIVSGEWKGTNWYKEIKNNNAPIQSHAISITGGSQESSYFTSFSYATQEGTLGKPVQTKSDKFTFRMNSDHTMMKLHGRNFIRIGENMNFVHGKKTGALGGQSSDGLGALGMVMGGSPFMPVYDEKGDYHGPIAYAPYSPNPLAFLIYNSQRKSKVYQMNANVFMTVEPIKDLTFRTSFGIVMDGSEDRSYTPTYNLAPEYTSVENKVSQSMGLGLSRWLFENTLNYKFSIKNNHNFDVLVGMSAERGGLGTSISGYNTNSIFDGFKYAYLTNTPKVNSTSARIAGSPWAKTGLLSYFGRINYDYKEKYMLTLVVRADGSSTFAPGHRWGTFPSISGGWALTNEPFMQPLTKVLDFFKIRASWGQNGNQSVGMYQYLAKIRVGGANAGDYPGVEYSYYYPGGDKNSYTIASYPINLPNPDITWETSEQINVGFDARLFRSRMGINFDWYRKTTKDWLVAAPVLASYGALAPDINGGDVRNSGIELGLTWRDQVGDFRYDVNVNYAFNKNRVTRIANNEGVIHGAIKVLNGQTPEFYRAQVGYPIGYFWGVKSAGIFQNQDQIDSYRNSKGEIVMSNAVPGDVIYVNQNDDDVIDENDRVLMGDPNPDGTFSFSIGLGYKGFDLRASASGVYGNQILGGTHDPLDRWHGDGTSNKWPRLGQSAYQNIVSDLNLCDGDYLRLNDLTIGYDFTSLFKRKTVLSQLRLFVTGQNLFTWTKYTGLDPEIGVGPSSWMSGVDRGFYPAARTFLFGINIKF